MNDRPETKHEKFERLRDARLPKILHALDILSNLGGSAYESSEKERRDVIDQLDAAVDAVAEKFGIGKPEMVTSDNVTESGATEKACIPEKQAKTVASDDAVPHTFIADGGSTALSEIQWAYDAIRRGDKKLAENRLHRILTAVRES